MVDGIYTLANDVVCNQLVALLNSIELHAPELPVCVIAYDHQLKRVREAIASRPNVTLLDDEALFSRWENFSRDVWATHPTALNIWQDRGIMDVYRLKSNHRYAVFDLDAPFDRFLYLDADTLLLNSPKIFFDALDQHEVVVYDFQHKDPSHIFNLASTQLTNIFSVEQIQRSIFCAGCYASRKGFFDLKTREDLVANLASGEADVLYMNAPNQSVLNYMVMRSPLEVYNLALHLPASQSTGNSVTSSHFEERDHLIYDRGIRLTYLHYIGLDASLFNQLCSGLNVIFPYRDTFLDYRYRHEPQTRPRLTGKPINLPPSLLQRGLRKLGLRQ